MAQCNLMVNIEERGVFPIKLWFMEANNTWNLWLIKNIPKQHETAPFSYGRHTPPESGGSEPDEKCLHLLLRFSNSEPCHKYEIFFPVYPCEKIWTSCPFTTSTVIPDIPYYYHDTINISSHLGWGRDLGSPYFLIYDSHRSNSDGWRRHLKVVTISPKVWIFLRQ
jgi:hypothetical protein